MINKKQLLRHMHFTRAERHGTAALLLLAAAVFVAPDAYRFWRKPVNTDFSAFARQIQEAESAMNTATAAPGVSAVLSPFDPNTASVEMFVQLGLSEKVARTIVKYRERGGRFRSADDLQKIYTLPEEDFERLKPFVHIGESYSGPGKLAATKAEKPIQCFPFDPNTAQEAELLQLGLPRALVARLLKYREKGGVFFAKPDFRKLYGLSENDYLRLEPYITIASRDLTVSPSAYAGGSSPRKAPQRAIDINTATPEAWQQLPGIGPARANKITRYRDRLGGFTRIDQVAETYGLPDSVFEEIRPFLQLETPVFRKIDLNTTTEDALRAHPFFSYKQAQLIIAYREQHGPFSTVSELSRITPLADPAWLEKIRPYLTVEGGR